MYSLNCNHNKESLFLHIYYINVEKTFLSLFLWLSGEVKLIEIENIFISPMCNSIGWFIVAHSILVINVAQLTMLHK